MAFVQSINASTSSGVTSLATSGITTTSGDTLVVGVAAFVSTTSVSISDNFGNNWLPHPQNPLKAAATGVAVYAFYAANIVGGSNHQVTANVSPANNFSIIVHEYTGRALDFPITATAGASDASTSTSHNVGSITTPWAGCDLFAFASDNTASANEGFTAGSGWNIPVNSTNANGTQYRVSMAMYQQNVAKGTYTGSFSTSDSIFATGLMFAIKQPSYTFIQQQSGSTGVTSSTLTVPGSAVAVTTGNLLIYIAKYSASSIQSVTITDTLNNTWQQINSFFDSATNTGIAFGFSKNIVGGQDQFVLTIGTTQNFLGLYVAEWAGLSTSNPFTTGEFVVNKVVAPGNGADGVASSFTGSIARRPALLFGFCIDSNNTSGQVLSPGTNFNPLSGVWLFGSGQTSSLPEHQRI